ncbi:inositol polyphosphate 5-phosphatase OCRL-like [Hydractinia symbiolongicarpus]|uniref:inositol polyphosphate 5-phosphatase OCRL-like n=1 Tax=Hydractinia symbiolongicarpus TaxID=13093 RepID=UPI002550E0DA|nr:inositol polyphosphate 5-phosphatase OCRL-like [Hydractinia symbiolongicarpus]
MTTQIKKVQSLLRNGETCKYCLEGSLVSGWTRTPHLFAIVRSQVNNYGLLILSHPGIGSNETIIRPKSAIPMDGNFRYLLNNSGTNFSSSDIQLQLTSGSNTYTAEFASGSAMQDFMSVLTSMYNGTGISTSYEWLKAYNGVNNDADSSQGEWPWNEITKPSVADYTPIAFDADADITNFDPLSSASKKDCSIKDDLLKDYDEIVPNTECLNISGTKENNLLEVTPVRVIPTNELDLKDFDPLSKEEIEKGIKTEKMISAELLRRSREVVSTRASAGKSWLERTLSQSSGSTETKESGGQEEAFDVVDNLEVQNVRNENTAPPPYKGNLSGNVFKGMRARENFIRLHMAAREKEFTELFPFTLLAGTWNVNGQLATESLVPWLQDNPESPDVIAIGFQELDLSAEALVFNDSSREDTWMKAIENGLPKNTDYFKLKHVRLVGMMLVVYVQTKHKMQVSDVESETYGTGIMGMMGNKGGVAVRFQLHNSTICFVNSHLAAHLMEYERRNQDFREVYSKLKFSLFQPPIGISQHNMVFWLGDLNYRFDDLDPDQVKNLVRKNDFAKLYKYDQLNRQQTQQKAFDGFNEGSLTFAPTYKYDPGTDDWDTSEKSRAPAWCDRVLWKGKQIEQIAYRSHPQLKLSDHKPVSALFTVGIKVVDRARERKVFEEIVRKLDKRENDSLPQVKLGKHEFQFDIVEFMEERVEVLPVANIGQSPVEFQFIAKLDDADIAKPWFRVNPSAGFIMPGDVLEIELSVMVDKLSAPMVTVGNCILDDILVLHLVDGKDFFVPLSGVYTPSVFGSSLEALVRIYGPIRQVPMDSLIQLESIASVFDSTDGVFPDSTEPLEIPKELWLLIDHLFKHGMTQENILLQSGIDEEIRQIRHHLDTGQGGEIPGSIFSIGEALLLFLEALPEPVIPYKYHTRCLEACNNYVLCKQVVTQLPECHGNVFRYLTAFLRELLKQSAENKLDAKMLATVMGSILLRSPMNQSKNLTRRTQSQIAQKKAKFVFHFLVNDFRG